MSQELYFPVAMTIAGSDSGGGAGIQADLRTFTTLGVYGCSAITALTAQNPLGVTDIAPVPISNVRAQIQAVLSAFAVKAVKTGMLFSEEIIDAVVEELAEFKGALIVDPVMVSTSGSRLLRDDAIECLMKRLLPRAAIVTPNRFEAEILANMKIKTFEDMKTAAKICFDKFGCGVVMKGGHSEDPENAVDYVQLEGETFQLSEKRLALQELATHGTGCTFSAAIAAGIAKGLDMKSALKDAKAFVQSSLKNNVRTGRDFCSMFPAEYLKKGNAQCP